MARRKKKQEVLVPAKEAEIVTTVETKKTVKKIFSCEVKKMIKNPLRLSLSITLDDFKPYPLKKAQLDDEIFMEHVKKLVSLKKLEIV